MARKPYQTEPILHNLYVVQNMTDSEIADIFDVSPSLITHWRSKNGIDGVKPQEYAASRPASYRVQTNGYTVWDANKNDEKRFCYVHRLLAVCEHGAQVFSDGREVHHKNGIKWDNRPENLDVVDVNEHRRMHANERRNEKTGRFE
jgi:hypothetical protein